MKKAQSTQLAVLRRAMTRSAEPRKGGRTSSAAFDEAFDAAQRAQAAALKPQLVEPVRLPLKAQASASLVGSGGQQGPKLKLPREQAIADERGPAPSRAGLAAKEAPAPFLLEKPAPTLTTAAAPLDPPAAVAAPRHVDPAGSLLQLALHDASLTVDLQARVVHVALETEAAGPLQLEVRVEEHRAHLHVEGPATALMAQHEPALREVLSSQGLSLGDFSLGERQPEPRPDAPEPEARSAHPSSPPGVTAPSAPKRHAGRIDVEA